MKYAFYYEVLRIGLKQMRTIEAENFRDARSKFFDMMEDRPHRVDSVMEFDDHDRLIKIYH